MKLVDSSSKDCPSCGLTNPSSACVCDCGYDFNTGVIEGKSTPRVSVLTVVTKLVVIAGIIAAWALLFAFIRSSGFNLGAIPAVIISAPFIFLWWKIYNSPGGEIAMLVLVLIMLAGVGYLAIS